MVTHHVFAGTQPARSRGRPLLLDYLWNATWPTPPLVVRTNQLRPSMSFPYGVEVAGVDTRSR